MDFYYTEEPDESDDTDCLTGLDDKAIEEKVTGLVKEAQ